MSKGAFDSHFLTNAIKNSLLEISQSAENLNFTEITTDSRKIPKNSLFFGIRGEKFDGNNYAIEAIQKGAAAAIVDDVKVWDQNKSRPLILVKDATAALRELAFQWRRKFTIPVIAVAGSAGKSTTKELVAATLSGRYHSVLKTEASQNGFLGIPLTLMKLRKEHEVAVIEVGIDDIGAMEKHIDLLFPTASIVTSIGPEHLENLKDVETVAVEEMVALKKTARSEGVVFLNVDDPFIREASDILQTDRIVGFSLNESSGSDFIDLNFEKFFLGRQSEDGTRLYIQSSYSDFSVELDSPLPGPHNARNLLGSVAICAQFGLSPEQIRKGLKTFKGLPGRSEVTRSRAGHLTICDYYNSSPSSLTEALSLLGRLSAKGEKWACLGDMLELGEQEEALHRSMAIPIQKNQIDHVLLYGPRMESLKSELEKTHYSGTVKHFKDHESLYKHLISGVTKEDTILIKGSRGMKMETIWSLLNDPSSNP